MYITTKDIEARLDPKHLLELADDDNDGVADEAVVAACIADAEAQVDLYLKGRYTVPLDPAPAVICKLAADLAIAGLFARRREAASPVHAERAELATDMLMSIAEGKILLAESSENLLKGAPQSTTRGLDKTFSKESLGSF